VHACTPAAEPPTSKGQPPPDPFDPPRKEPRFRAIERALKFPD
jgi:hypothetical protein